MKWRCPVCKHDHEMFDEKRPASCLTCPCEHRYGDDISEPEVVLFPGIEIVDEEQAR